MTFYHGSYKKFRHGFLLRPQADGYVNRPEVAEFETLVETRRPVGKLSRSKCVFLSMDIELIDGAGGCIDAVYHVVPIGDPEASDLAWYTEASMVFHDGCADKTTLNALIDRYWSGQPYPNAEISNVEYRASAARVEKLVELNVDIGELEDVEMSQSCDSGKSM